MVRRSTPPPAPADAGRRIALVSSGTGGHLWPALVLADALSARGDRPLVVTEGRAVERDILGRRGTAATALPLHGRRMGRLLRLPLAVARARALLRRERVEAVVGTGGAIAAVVGAAAWTLGIPVFLLEMNATLGRGNRLLRPFARRVFLSLPLDGDPVRGCVVTGAPLRGDLAWTETGEQEQGQVVAEARRRLGLEVDCTTILVTGGSQGARSLNDRVPEALARVVAARPRLHLQVIHLAGAGGDERVRRRYLDCMQEHGLAEGRLDVVVRSVALDMAKLYAAADLVVSRSGGGTVAELMAVGRASLLVPYPHHRDQQQKRNGRILVARGAARMLEEADLTEGTLAAEVGGLLDDPAGLAAMGACARSIRPGDATCNILDEVARCLGSARRVPGGADPAVAVRRGTPAGTDREGTVA